MSRAMDYTIATFRADDGDQGEDDRLTGPMCHACGGPHEDPESNYCEDCAEEASEDEACDECRANGPHCGCGCARS